MEEWKSHSLSTFPCRKLAPTAQQAESRGTLGRSAPFPLVSIPPRFRKPRSAGPNKSWNIAPPKRRLTGQAALTQGSLKTQPPLLPLACSRTGRTELASEADVPETNMAMCLPWALNDEARGVEGWVKLAPDEGVDDLPPTVPPDPPEMNPEAADSGVMELQWSLPGRLVGVRGYEVRYGYRFLGGWNLIATKGDEQRCLLPGLQPGVQYVAQVRAVFYGGGTSGGDFVGPWSYSSLHVVPPRDPNVPEAPRLVVASDDSLVVSWTPLQQPVVRYQVRYMAVSPGRPEEWTMVEPPEDVEWVWVEGSENCVTMCRLSPHTPYITQCRAIFDTESGEVEGAWSASSQEMVTTAGLEQHTLLEACLLMWVNPSVHGLPGIAESTESRRARYLLKHDGDVHAAVEEAIVNASSPFRVAPAVHLALSCFPGVGTAARFAYPIWNQLRLLALIAALHGHDVNTEMVKCHMLLCLTVGSTLAFNRCAVKWGFTKVAKIVASQLMARVVTTHVLGTLATGLLPFGALFDLLWDETDRVARTGQRFFGRVDEHAEDAAAQKTDTHQPMLPPADHRPPSP